MNAEPFLKPRLTGARFEGGVVPLHVLADFAILEQMIVDIAKWKFLEENENRSRVPRGFTEGISLKLTGVEQGSAIPIINLFFAASTLFPPDAKSYFEEARAEIVKSIRYAEQDLHISNLPPKLLSYFGRFGRSLEPGEAVEFSDDVGGTAKLTQLTRHRLVIASNIKEYAEDIELRGTVTGMEVKEEWFNLVRSDTTKVKIPLTEPHIDTIRKAFNCYAIGKKMTLRIQASGRFDRERKLKGIESVEQVVVIDPLDIRDRVEELKLLENGWLDGKGIVPSPAALDSFVSVFEMNYRDELQLPYLFLTPTGKVLAEWSLPSWSLSLEIDTVTLKADWHELNLATDSEDEREIDLGNSGDWQWVAENIRSKGGVAE